MYYYGLQFANELEVQELNDSFFNFFGTILDYAYGELYYGMYVYVEVYGYPQDTPKVTFNYLPGVVKSTDNVTSLSGNIINGTRYKFFIPIIEYEEGLVVNDVDAYGTVRIYNGLDLKRTFTIF